MKLLLVEMTDSFPVSVPGGQSGEKFPSSINAVCLTGGPRGLGLE